MINIYDLIYSMTCEDLDYLNDRLDERRKEREKESDDEWLVKEWKERK